LTKDNISIGIFSFRLFILFLNVLIIGAKYIMEIMGDRAEPWPTPTLVLNGREEKLFQVYVVEKFE